MVGLERLLIGRTLGGRYTVEEQIGRGRGGLVYRVRDAETAVEVALKVLAAPQSAEARERYRRVVAGEVRSAAALQHPNVLAVLALGTDEELNLDFVTGELARGQTLASVLAQRGPPPVALGLRLLSEAAEGLGAGHRAGLVHRDLRPASLYLVRSEAERQVRVKVGGFGVPQIVRRESLAAAPPEVSAYASPELLMGGSARLTPASDVFGLGVVGFQLMTGALPFGDDARRALAEGGAAEIALPRELSPAVPPHVFEAVLQALRIAPAERFADAGAFAEALRQPASRPAVPVSSAFPAAGTPAPAPETVPVEPTPVASEVPEAATPVAEVALAADAGAMADAISPAASEITTAAAEPDAASSPATDAFVAHPGGLLSVDDVPAEAPTASADPSPASEPAAVSIPPVIEVAAPAAPAPEPIRPPAAATPARTRPAPKPKAAGADLELYYPPQLTATPAAASRPGEAPAAPVTARASIPVSPAVAAAATEMPAPAIAAEAAAAPPETSAAPMAPLSPVAPRAVSIGGRRQPRAGAGSGGFRGSPAMAAGFVLGMLVLGTVGWMATRRPSGAAAAPHGLAANQPAPGASAPAASAPATAAPTAEPQRVAIPIGATAADSAEARRLAREEARKRQEDEARKRQQDEQARLALQQQQAAAQAQQAPPQQPAARPQPAAPPPVQQPVAVAQRPAAPAPPPPAPPPAAPAREEPAPARAAASNEVYDISDVGERPRLANGGEIQRALATRYPGELASSGVSGSVTATFVVNPDGRVDPSSIRIVSSPNAAFNGPTQSVLRRARFRPATVHGQPVRVQVSMPVQWTAPQ
jgi:serine/threonine-protein kinase